MIKKLVSNLNFNEMVVEKCESILVNRFYRKPTTLKELTKLREKLVNDINNALLGITNSISNITVDDGYNYDIIDSVAILKKYSGNDTEIILPKYILHDDNYYAVLSIAPNAFKNSGITKIQFHNLLTYIGDSAFQNCYNLNTLEDLPNSISYIGISAFADCYQLPNFKFPTSLSTIEEYSFCNCTNITEFDFTNIKEIKIGAIGGTYENSITSLTFPIDIKVDNSAFLNVYPEYIKSTRLYPGIYPNNVLTIIIPDDTLSLHQTAFLCCQNCTDLYIPESLTSIGQYSFYGVAPLNLSAVYAPKELDNSKIININILSDITIISAFSFKDCYSLQTINMPDTIVEIRDSAFENCSSVSQINFSENLTSFSGWVFRNNFNLSVVHLPQKLEYIGWHSFSNCSSLTAITLPPTIKFIDQYAFDGCNNIRMKYLFNPGWEFPPNVGTNIFKDNSYNAKGYYYKTIGWFESINSDGYWNTLNMIEYLKEENFIFKDYGNGDVSILSLNNNLSTENIVKSISNVVIPYYTLNNDKIIGIEENVFQNCNMSEVMLPDDLHFIKQYAFQNCSNLLSIELPLYNFNKLEYGLFESCSSLLSIDIPDNVIEIQNECFKNCISLSNIKLPSNIKYIAQNLFENCYSLSTINLHRNISYIYDEAFKNCSNLISIDIADSIINLGNSTFENCTNLMSVVLPDGRLLNIPNRFLYNCYNISTIYLPHTLTTINDEAFANCSNLISVSIPNYITKIGDAVFENCSLLSNVNLKENITTIGNYAFNNCINLYKINMVSSLTSIGEYAFNNCSNLTAFHIPSSIVNINDNSLPPSTKNLIKITSDNPKYFCNEKRNLFYNQERTEIKLVALGNIRGSIVFENNLTSIYEKAFEDCIYITDIKLNNNLQRIETSAFIGCYNIDSFNAPTSLTSIGNDAFKGCQNISYIKFENDFIQNLFENYNEWGLLPGTKLIFNNREIII